jgi:ATP-dependent Clp protease ATP-binding subunit ClpC
MFERYTEKARRVIFFSRYEASQFGSTTIEAEHMLLGLLREDNNLIGHFLPSIVGIREEIRNRTTIREKTATSINLPLTDECNRLLAYAAEEAEQMNHDHIGAEHLLLGIIREEKCLAASGRLITTEVGRTAGLGPGVPEPVGPANGNRTVTGSPKIVESSGPRS